MCLFETELNPLVPQTKWCWFDGTRVCRNTEGKYPNMMSSANGRPIVKGRLQNSVRSEGVQGHRGIPPPGSINKAWLKGAWWLILPEWGLVSWGYGIWGRGWYFYMCMRFVLPTLFYVFASCGWDILSSRGWRNSKPQDPHKILSILHVFW